MLTLTRAAAALALAATSLALSPSASALSCVQTEYRVHEVDHVFVGSIVDVRGDSVQFEVTEVWKGGDLPPRLWLERDPEMDVWLPFATDGRLEDGYSSSEEHLVTTGEDFFLGPCDLHPVADPAEYGPADAPRPPVSDQEAGMEPAAPPSRVTAVAGGVGVAAVGAVLVLLRRRRRPE